MIHRISSDQPTFRSVRFEPGFNVVLADRTEASSSKDSRNGLGKTTIVHIVHFCLGSDGAELAAPQLNDWAFTLDLDLLGKLIRVTRRVGPAAGKVLIDGNTSDWPIQPKKEKKSGERTLKIGEWRVVLGQLMFGLSAEKGVDKFGPTFRALLPYFARNTSHAYTEPFEIFDKQQVWQRQVANAYLLGLEWRHSQELQLLRERDKQLGELKRLVESGVMVGLIGEDLGALEARKVQLEVQRDKQAAQLRDFRVVEQYRVIEQEANRLTKEIHTATNQNIEDRRQRDMYASALGEEQAPIDDEIEALYAQAGVDLPDAVRKRLEEVRGFHKQVLVNRQRFLAGEISALNAAIDQRTQQLQTLSFERSRRLAVLREGRALDEFTQLQSLLTKREADLNAVVQRIANWKKLDTGRSELKIEREQLALRARNDFEDREPLRKKAMEAFNVYSEALYEAPGSLVLNVRPSGLTLDVEIERQQSEGVKQMKVFCYDLTLASIWSARDRSPGFVIHDSPLFADVDERQIARALHLAAKESARLGYQYICMFNSDKLPKTEDYPEAFDVEKFVRLRLTDDSPEGGLLGIRF